MSSTVRVSTPSQARPAPTSPRSGPIETRPALGLSPTSPQHDAGIRIDPPRSLPSASATMPEATAAALPPDEPPLERSVRQGFRVSAVAGVLGRSGGGRARACSSCRSRRPRLAQAPHVCRVVIGRPVAEGAAALRRRQILGGREQILEPDRNAGRAAADRPDGRLRPRPARDPRRARRTRSARGSAARSAESEASTSSRAETAPARTALACSTALSRRTSTGAPVSSAVAALLARSMSERVSSGPVPSAHRCRYPNADAALRMFAQASPLPIAQAVAAARAVRPETPIFP